MSPAFTAVELLITLTLVAILLAFGVPSYKTFVANNRMTAQYNQVLASLNLARSEAVKRGSSVTICKSSDGASCDTGGNHWEEGWIVFADTGTIGSAAGDTILQVAGHLKGDNTLRPSMAAGSATAFDNYVTFKGSGIAYGSGGGATGQAGSLALCDTRGVQEAKAININASGRIALATDTDAAADGIVNNASGSNVSCP